MGLRKVAVACCAAVVMVLGMLAVSGCGQNDEQVIRDGVTQELEGLKNLDETTLDEVMSGADSSALSELGTYGIDGREFMKRYLAGFDYTLDDVQVDGSTAEVTVTFTCKSFNDFEAALTDAVSGLIADESIYSLSEDELNARIGETFMTTVDTVEPRTTEPFVLEYNKSGNTWEPGSSAEAAIVQALFA